MATQQQIQEVIDLAKQGLPNAAMGRAEKYNITGPDVDEAKVWYDAGCSRMTCYCLSVQLAASSVKTDESEGR